MRLPAVLTPPLFPEAELSALALDGEAFRLGDAVVPMDVPVGAAVRAASIADAAGRRGLIPERWTAAWVHGVVPVAPRPHQLCNDADRNGRTRMLPGLREVVLRPGDVVELAGLPVTSPLRTACDLARFEPPSPGVDDVLLALLALAGVTPRVAAAHLIAGPQTPAKREGVRRLRSLDGRGACGRGT